MSELPTSKKYLYGELASRFIELTYSDPSIQATMAINDFAEWLEKHLAPETHDEQCDVNDPIIKGKPCNCKNRVPVETSCCERCVAGWERDYRGLHFPPGGGAPVRCSDLVRPAVKAR